MFILFVFLFKLFSYVRSAKILVTTIAVNIDDITPIDSVTANPLIGPVPKINNIIDAIKVVIFASAIVEKAFLYPSSIEANGVEPLATSSFILSKIKTFASTAIPTVKIIPAIPGNVNVAPNNVNIPTKKNRLASNVTLAIKPNILYLKNIKIITSKKPIINAMTPALIESCPRSGPTVLSSIMFSGAGRAPDLSSKAKSVAD